VGQVFQFAFNIFAVPDDFFRSSLSLLDNRVYLFPGGFPHISDDKGGQFVKQTRRFPRRKVGRHCQFAEFVAVPLLGFNVPGLAPVYGQPHVKRNQIGFEGNVLNRFDDGKSLGYLIGMLGDACDAVMGFHHPVGHRVGSVGD
jgi:hypothetical protein